jgi:Flp pilus assembly protein TadG
MSLQPLSIAANRRERRCDGVAAVEFALIAPLLLVLLTGVGEVGIAAHQRLQVEAAAEVGALYAARHGDGDLTAIGTAVVNGTGTSGITATPVPAKFCGCPTASDVVSQGTNCTTVCPDTKPPGHYVTVSAAITHQTLLPYLNLAIGTLTASSTIRVK